jgi:hypothetical protein
VANTVPAACNPCLVGPLPDSSMCRAAPSRQLLNSCPAATCSSLAAACRPRPCMPCECQVLPCTWLPCSFPAALPQLHGSCIAATGQLPAGLPLGHLEDADIDGPGARLVGVLLHQRQLQPPRLERLHHTPCTAPSLLHSAAVIGTTRLEWTPPRCRRNTHS